MSNKKEFNQDVSEAFYTNERYAENLVYHDQYCLFYLYENGHYKKLDPVAMRKEVMAFIRKNFKHQNWTIGAIKDIVQWIEHECIRQVSEEHRNYIAFKDCLYNTNTFETEEFDKEKIATYYLPFNYKDTKMEIPNFKRFLDSSLVNKEMLPDPQLHKVAQEMLGSLFIDNLKASRAYFLYGKTGQNGKSTFTKLIRKIIGKEFYSSLALSNLGEKFGLAPLIGMKVNIRDELDDKFGSSKIFKELVTGETVGDQHKYGQHFTLNNRAKFIFSTNVMATFDGLDGGLRRRLLFIPFYREFKDGDIDKDFDLEDKLESEIPGIVGWALEGAKRLVKNKYVFTKSEATKEIMAEFEDEASTSIRFFRDNYNISNDFTQFIPVQKIYNDYLYWMNSEGLHKPAGKKRFTSDITGVWSELFLKNAHYSDNEIPAKTYRCINAYPNYDEELSTAGEQQDIPL